MNLGANLDSLPPLGEACAVSKCRFLTHGCSLWEASIFWKSIMKKILALAILVLSSLAHAQYSGTDYSGADVRRAMPAQTGVVIDVVASDLRVESSTTARVVGASGASLACTLGSRRMTDWSARAAVIGLCGLAGERAGSAFGTDNRRASTLIVRGDDNRVVAVVQEDANIHVGSRVYLINGGGTTRVVLAGR